MHCFRCNTDSNDRMSCERCGNPLETDPDRYFKAGMDSMAAGDLQHAVTLLKDCVSLDPNHLNGRYNLGTALCLADKCTKGMKEYIAVAEADPNYPGICTAMGQAALGNYLRHMELAEANREAMFDMLTRAVEQEPEDVDALYSLASAHIAVGAEEEAIAILDEAMNLNPDLPHIHFAVAKALKMMGKCSEAVVVAERSMALSAPDDPLAPEIESLVFELRQSGLKDLLNERVCE